MYTAEQIAVIVEKKSYRHGCGMQRCKGNPCHIDFKAFNILGSEVSIGNDGDGNSTLDSIYIRLSDYDRSPITEILAGEQLIVRTQMGAEVVYDIATLDPNDPTVVCFSTSGTPLTQNASTDSAIWQLVLTSDFKLVGDVNALGVNVELLINSAW